MKQFLENFADQFEDTDAAIIKPETKYKELEEWDSMVSLSVIAMADEAYNVELKGDDIRNTSTIQELFDIIKSKAK